MLITALIYFSCLCAAVIFYLWGNIVGGQKVKELQQSINAKREIIARETDRTQHYLRRYNETLTEIKREKETARLLNNKLACIQDVLANKPLSDVVLALSATLTKTYAAIPPEAGSTHGCGAHVSGPMSKDGPSVRIQKR